MSNEITAPITIVRNVINAPISFGVTGKSAYQSYLDTTDDDPVLTEAEWSTGGGGGAPSEHAANHAAGGTDPICYHSDTAPLTAEPGQKWLQTSTGREYEFFAEAWVEVASGPALDLSGYALTADLGTASTASLPMPISLNHGPHNLLYVYSTPGITHQMARVAFQGPTYKVACIRCTFPLWIPDITNSIVSKTVTAVVRASIEYPVGVMHPLYFNGRRDVVIDEKGQATTDALDIQIPANAQFWIRTFIGCRNGDLLALRSNNYIASSSGGMVIGIAGSAATASLTVASGAVSTVSLTASGGGYTPSTEILCNVTGTGTGAVIYALVGAAGVVDTFRIAAGGSGYTGTPTIAIPGNGTGTNSYGGIPIDQTTAGTITTFSGAFALYGPSLITAIPTDGLKHRSYAIIGDSISAGYYDTNAGIGGWAKRVFDTSKIPMVNLSLGGASLYRSYISGSSMWLHLGLGKSCTDAIIALGRNDLTDSRTLVQMQADFGLLVAELRGRGLRVSACTVSPGTNVGNTAPVTGESTRVGFNDWLRTNPLGLEQIYDTADTLETSRNSGIWNSGMFYTDGIHVTAAGFTAMAAAFADLTN